MGSFDVTDNIDGTPFFDEFGDPRQDVDFAIRLDDAVAAGVIDNNSFASSGYDINIGGTLVGEIAKNLAWEFNATFSQNNDDERILDFSAPLINVFLNNLLRSDFATSTEAQDLLQSGVQRLEIESQSELFNLQAFLRGGLFSDRGAGPLSFVVGVERRSESTSTFTTTEAVFGTFTSGLDLDDEQVTLAAFGEIGFPITGRLILNLAARYEDVEIDGNTVTQQDALATFIANGGIDQFTPIDVTAPFSSSSSGFSPRAGLAWTPIDELKLRGTIGQSFRAPNAAEVGAPSLVLSQFQFPDPILIDPMTGEELDPIDVPFITGGNPNLSFETADTINLGIEFTPQIFGSNLRLVVDYNRIEFNNRVSNSFEAFFPGIQDFSGRILEGGIVRADDGTPLFLFDGPVNFATEVIESLDVRANYAFDIGQVSFDNRFAMTRQLSEERLAFDGSEVENTLGILNPRTRFNMVSTASYGGLNVTAAWNYVGSYRGISIDFDTGEDIFPVVDGFSTFDLQASYELPESLGAGAGWQITMGASNLFNEGPPLTITGDGFDASNYDLRRRRLFVDLRKRF